MNPFQFLKQMNSLPPPGGDGIRVERQLNPIADLRTTAGLVLTAATTPAVVAAETNALVVQAVASSNVLGSFVLAVPKDYDIVKDELTIRVVAQMGGATDTPTLNASAFRKRAGAALSAGLTTVASAALSNAAKEVTITVSGNGLRQDDMLTINLTSGAHTTDAINIYGVDVVYRSSIVTSDPTQR
jgi:hypothetical protein